MKSSGLTDVTNVAGPADKGRMLPLGVGKFVAQLAIVFVAYLVAGKLGQATTNVRSSNLGPVWPAYGVALVAALLYGSRVWPAIWSAAFVVAFFSPVPHLAAAGQAAAATLGALTGSLVLLRVAKFQLSVSRLRDSLNLIVLGAFGSAAVSASIGIYVLYATHVQAYSGLPSAWLIYWLGDSTGVLLITPLVLTFSIFFDIRPRVRLAELAGLLLLLTSVCFVVFGDLPAIQVKLHVLAFAVLPFVMWAAIRFGVAGASLSTLIIATIATIETALNAGPFAQNTTFVNAVLLDVFFTVLAISGMTLGSVVSERERSEHESERLIGEHAAMEARLRLATIVESTDDAIIGEDINGMVTDWNKGAERLYGYSATDVMGKSISLVVPPDASGGFVDVVWMRETISCETVHLRKGGMPIEVSLTISPIKDVDGRIVGASAIVRDITKQKRQETVLRESEERFRLAAQAGKMYAFEWDATTDVVIRSAESSETLGIGDANKFTLQKGLDFVYPDDRNRVVDAIASLKPESSQIQITFRLLGPDGAFDWVEGSALAHFDEEGRMLRIVGMVADITERKQAEEALRESEEKLRLLLNSTAEAIYGIDLEGNCTFCNPACLRTLGYERTEQLLGKNMHNLIHHTRGDGSKLPIEECRIHRALRTGEGIHVDDEVLWRADKTSFPAEYWSYPQRRDGEIVGAVIAFIDITRRRLGEEAFASVNRRLIEAQEQERFRISRELHDDICQRLALLALELGQLPQEFRGLPSEALGRVNELQKQLLEIASDTQSMSHKLHSSKLRHLGLTVAMKGFCEEFGRQQKVKIDFKAHDLPGNVPQDISLCLFRVLQEALHNAAKHSGVLQFAVELWRTSEEIHLTVSDHGAGFSSLAARESQGLGFISMKERVQLVKGSFSISSEPDQGTTVHARVPFNSEISSSLTVEHR